MTMAVNNPHLLSAPNPAPKLDLAYKAQYRYVAMMLDIVGRSLVMSSQIDSVIQDEIDALPEQLTIIMSVYGTSLGFVVQAQSLATDNGGHAKRLVWLGSLTDAHPSSDGNALKIYFKHLRFAYQILSFQESTATGFANNRMVVDGDVALAVILVRCLNRLESVILPKILAKKAIKAYPATLDLPQKLSHALRIYGRLVMSYVFSPSTPNRST